MTKMRNSMVIKFFFLAIVVFSANLVEANDSIRVEKITQNNWGAVIHYPTFTKTPTPVIITIGGSEGGLSFVEEEANKMAKEGFIIMRFGYFKYSKEKLNQTLNEIPIEKVFEAIEYIKKSTLVDSTKIALLGISKGAELGLLVASKNNSVKAVVAHLPSYVVWYGMGKWIGLNKSSWTYKGKPLAFVPSAKPKSGWFTKRIAEFYEAGLEKHPDKIDSAKILVEKISGPILLTSGGKDDIWPSFYMAKEIEKRLKSVNFAFEVKHLHYPEAGHGIFGLCPEPNDSKAMNNLAAGGGTPEANYNARKETWEETFKFLKRVLGTNE
jgi:dienelactone hydrolase